MIEETVGPIPSEPGSNDANSNYPLDNGWYKYTITDTKKLNNGQVREDEEVRYRQGQDNLPEGVNEKDLVALKVEEEIGRVGNSIFVFDPKSHSLLRGVPVRRIDMPMKTRIGKHK